MITVIDDPQYPAGMLCCGAAGDTGACRRDVTIVLALDTDAEYICAAGHRLGPGPLHVSSPEDQPIDPVRRNGASPPPTQVSRSSRRLATTTTARAGTQRGLADRRMDARAFLGRDERYTGRCECRPRTFTGQPYGDARSPGNRTSAARAPGRSARDDGQDSGRVPPTGPPRSRSATVWRSGPRPGSPRHTAPAGSDARGPRRRRRAGVHRGGRIEPPVRPPVDRRLEFGVDHGPTVRWAVTRAIACRDPAKPAQRQRSWTTTRPGPSSKRRRR